MATRNRASSAPIVETGVEDAPGRSLLKERAYTEIKQRILSGVLAPSTFLSERQMAGQLAMSKTPIRAALQRLEVEGLVTISPQQGIIVRDLSVHEIADLYEMRAALETYVARTLAGRLTVAWPWGETQDWDGLAVDRYWRLTAGEPRPQELYRP